VAYAVEAWLQRADLNGSLRNCFNSPLTLLETKMKGKKVSREMKP
jgi:hypothetical protein